MSVPLPPDDGGGSGGGGGTGGGTVPPPAPPVPPGAGGAGTIQGATNAPPSQTNIGGIILKATALDTAYQCQSIRVMPGEKVYIRPLPSNAVASVLRLGLYALQVMHGACDYVAAGDVEREFPVDNTGKIFIFGTAGEGAGAGDGIVVNIRRAA